MKYDDERIEYYSGSAWTDMSAYVSMNNTLTWSRGITGNSVADRVARPGNISFTLHDTTGQFDPINADKVISSGTPLRFVLDYEGIERCVWQGRILTISPRMDDLYNVFAQVTGVCVIDSYNRPLLTPAITIDKTLSEVVDEINEDLSLTVTDEQKRYGTMAKIFPSVFDTTRSKQNALGEISKAVISELGYFYARGSRNLTDGYIITVDGRNTREGLGYITIPKGISDSGFLLQETEDFLLRENDDKIILDEAEAFEAFAGVDTIMPAYGKNIVNDAIVTVYPREYSTSTEVLFSLTSTPSIDAGATLELTARYQDPDNQAQSITARTANQPAPNTDYTANAKADGTGTDLTSDLSVSAVYGAAEIKYTLENTGATKLYITKLQVRGEGIFFYSPLTLEASDATSQAANGVKTLSLNMKYLDDANEGKAIANAIVASAKDIFQDIDWIEVSPNASAQNLYACMFLDCGDPIKVTLPGTDGVQTARKYYVNGVSWAGVKGNWKVRYTLASQEVVEV